MPQGNLAGAGIFFIESLDKNRSKVLTQLLYSLTKGLGVVLIGMSHLSVSYHQGCLNFSVFSPCPLEEVVEGRVNDICMCQITAQDCSPSKLSKAGIK